MAIFYYPGYGPDEAHRDLVAHSGQSVEVVREVDEKEYDPNYGGERMFHIKAKDGWTSTAFESELSSTEIVTVH